MHEFERCTDLKDAVPTKVELRVSMWSHGTRRKEHRIYIRLMYQIKEPSMCLFKMIDKTI
jgi:hypothetical protein